MKKIFLMACFALATISMSAQNAVGHFSIQPKIGLGASTLTNIENAKTTGAGQLGAELEYQISDKFSVAGAVMATLQGCDFDDNILLEDQSYAMGYLQIPVVANFYVYKGLALKAGLQPGFRIYGNAHYKVKATGAKHDDKLVGYQDFDLAIPVGISYQLKRFVFDARYNIGVTKVNKDDYDKDVHHSVFMLTFGYKFNL